MSEPVTADICVIGAGAGGLSVAAGASQMGASVVLVEKGAMGGDCLNSGCVPSKALLAAAHAAENVRAAARLGVTAGAPVIDPDRVYGHVRATIAAIAPNDSVARFEALGVRVIEAAARFTGPTEVMAGDTLIRARRVVVATGSRPLVPPIEGLAETPYLTNETVFALSALPEHLIVVGGGPIGAEMAQAHRLLGSRVTMLEMGTILPKDDPELVEVVRARLLAQGVDIREGVRVTAARKDGAGVAVRFERDGETVEVAGSHLLIAAGRAANVDGLDLEKAGVIFDRRGIAVDRRLRTADKRVFAIGDVAVVEGVGALQFTHMAGYHAGIVIRNALFRLPAKVDARAVPWVTYTAPELAQVGLTEAQAMERHSDVRILRWPFHDNDRAHAEGKTEGLVKVMATPKGKILGAGVAGAHAGELIQPWVLAMSRGLKIGAMASMIAPYPTLAEVNKRAAGSFFVPALFGERTRKVVRFLSRFG